MSRGAAILLIATAITGCQQQPGFAQPTPAWAYKHWNDRFVALTGLPLPWRPYPCTTKKTERFAGDTFAVLESASTEDCVRMMPPRRWRGLWRNEFEGSTFCEDVRADCTFRTRPRIWLDAGPGDPPDQKLYEVEFIGRRTMFLGSYGHMGISDLEIVVDRMISKKEVRQAGAEKKA